MPRKPETPIGQELSVSRAPSPFLGSPTSAPSLPQEPPQAVLAPEPPPRAPEPLQEPQEKPQPPVSDRAGDIASLANLFNSQRKIQVAGSIPDDLYRVLSRKPGGVPEFFRSALDQPLTAYEVMLGAKAIQEMRKKALKATVTPKIDPSQYEKVAAIVKEATEGGVGMVTEAKVVAGIIYCAARREGLL